MLSQEPREAKAALGRLFFSLWPHWPREQRRTMTTLFRVGLRRMGRGSLSGADQDRGQFPLPLAGVVRSSRRHCHVCTTRYHQSFCGRSSQGMCHAPWLNSVSHRRHRHGEASPSWVGGLSASMRLASRSPPSSGAVATPESAPGDCF